MSILDFQYFIAIIVSFWILLQGYKLTKQGKSAFEMGWRQVTSDAQGGRMLSTMTMETNSSASTEMDVSTISQERLLFKREVGFFLFQLPIFYCVLGGDITNLFISDKLLWFLRRSIWKYNSFFSCLDFYLLNSFM